MVSWENLQRGFWFNGFMNTVGLLIFNQCFTSKLITPTYPELFSTEGMLTIMSVRVPLRAGASHGAGQ